MANHKSALKRARQDEVKRVRNLSYKTHVKKAVKAVRVAVSGHSEEQAVETLRKATSTLQKCASKGVIHKRKAARKISRLAHQVNHIKTESTPSSTKA